MPAVGYTARPRILIEVAMSCLFVEQLTVIDSSRLDPIDGLVGESWIVDVELTGTLDEQGMVLDFGDVKRELKAAIDDSVDHRLLVPEAATHLQRADGYVELAYGSKRGPIHMSGPEHTVVPIPGNTADAAAVRDFLHRSIRPLLPANVTELGLRLRNERIDGAWYAYSHGLQAHDGACQRIAHGHRSRLEVYRNGHRAPDWEAYWAERWRNVYLGSRQHLQATEDVDGVRCHRFGYTAREGAFRLTVPAAACEILEAQSTVEQIAAHLHAVMQERDPDARFSVRAFEGLGKGARAFG